MAMVRDRVTHDLIGGPPRRWPAIAAGATAAALAGVIAVVVMARGDAGGHRAVAPVVIAATTAAPAGPVAPASRTEALSLPQPTGYDGPVPLGYPRSVAGAIAAAYGYSRISTGVDIEPTLRSVEAIADPATGWFPRERDRLADGLVEQRRGLGLPPVGPTGAASITVTPSAYQLLGEPAATSVTVLTLNIVSAAATDGARTSGVVVLHWALRWDGTRWLATQLYSDDQHDDLAVTPLTSQARALGWQVARGG